MNTFHMISRAMVLVGLFFMQSEAVSNKIKMNAFNLERGLRPVTVFAVREVTHSSLAATGTSVAGYALHQGINNSCRAKAVTKSDIAKKTLVYGVADLGIRFLRDFDREKVYQKTAYKFIKQYSPKVAEALEKVMPIAVELASELTAEVLAEAFYEYVAMPTFGSNASTQEKNN